MHFIRRFASILHKQHVSSSTDGQQAAHTEVEWSGAQYPKHPLFLSNRNTPNLIAGHTCCAFKPEGEYTSPLENPNYLCLKIRQHVSLLLLLQKQ